MSCIRKRRGKWTIDYRDSSGVRRWLTTKGNRKQAEAELAKITNTGYQSNSTGKQTFEERALSWLETYAKNHTKPSTYYEYESTIRNHLVPAFGSLPFAKINREAVKTLIAEKVQAGYSRSHVRNIVVPLREMFNHAIDDGAVTTANPVSRIGRFNTKRDSASRKIDPLTRIEIQLLLETAREKFPAHLPLLLTAVRTGMRAGELAALQWGDVDFNSRFIQVQRNLSRGQLGSPKNGKTRRVDMSLQLTNCLDELYAIRKAEALRAGQDVDAVAESFVFHRTVRYQSHPSRLDPNDLRRQILYRVLDSAGIRRVRFHDLRHSFASLLIAQGESLPYIRDQLGHSSIAMTVDVYGHLVPGSNRSAVDRLDDQLELKGSKSVAPDQPSNRNLA